MVLIFFKCDSHRGTPGAKADRASIIILYKHQEQSCRCSLIFKYIS